MGTTADKIAKKLSPRLRSRFINMDSWNEAMELVADVGTGDDSRLISRFEISDPFHVHYIAGQHVASCFTEMLSWLKEARRLLKIIEDTEDFYMPGGPPISPLTKSYFTMWSMFDLRFGSSRETVGSCALRIARDAGFPPRMIEVLQQMQNSRMGFYVNCGVDDDRVFLREVGTQKTLSCVVPLRHTGWAGQIWFVRVLPPLEGLSPHHLIFNTPYILRDYPEAAFVEYFDRQIGRMMKQKKSRSREDTHRDLMKYGPDLTYWHEYVTRAYSNYQLEAVYLTGIPDIPESLPHD